MISATLGLALTVACSTKVTEDDCDDGYGRAADGECYELADSFLAQTTRRWTPTATVYRWVGSNDLDADEGPPPDEGSDEGPPPDEGGDEGPCRRGRRPGSTTLTRAATKVHHPMRVASTKDHHPMRAVTSTKDPPPTRAATKVHHPMKAAISMKDRLRTKVHHPMRADRLHAPRTLSARTLASKTE